MSKLLQIVEPGIQDESPHKIAIGIDLGTTHSLVSIVQKGEVQILTNENNEKLIPSVVSYEGGTVKVGMTALEEANSIKSIKRLMGRDFQDILEIRSEYNFLESQAKGSLQIRAGHKTLTPIEISAEILKSLKAQAERNLGHPVEQAVITVPAYFYEAARMATPDAARL